MPRQRIVRRAENITLDGRGDPPTPCGVESAVEQRLVVRPDAQSQRLVVVLEPKRRQRGRVDQGDAFHLGAPGIVRRGRVVEAQGKNPIARDATAGQNLQRSALFAREAFDRITKQRCNPAHRDPATADRAAARSR
jgi:hypothetical protein